MNERHEVTDREKFITEALELVATISLLVPMDTEDVAAFIEGFLQGKETGGKL